MTLKTLIFRRRCPERASGLRGLQKTVFRPLSRLFIFALILSAIPLSASNAKSQTVIVEPTRGKGVGSRVFKNAVKRIMKEVSRLSDIKAITQKRHRKLMKRCKESANSDCLNELALDAEVRFALRFHIDIAEDSNDRYEIFGELGFAALQARDVRQERFSWSKDKHLQSIKFERFMRQLISPESVVGVLKIDGAIPNSSVRIDGEHRAYIPVVAGIKLREGRHHVRIEREGYIPFEESVDIVFQQQITLDAQQIRGAWEAQEGDDNAHRFRVLTRKQGWILIGAGAGTAFLGGAGFLTSGLIAGGLEREAANGSLSFPDRRYALGRAGHIVGWAGTTLGLIVSAAGAYGVLLPRELEASE